MWIVTSLSLASGHSLELARMQNIKNWHVIKTLKNIGENLKASLTVKPPSDTADLCCSVAGVPSARSPASDCARYVCRSYACDTSSTAHLAPPRLFPATRPRASLPRPLRQPRHLSETPTTSSAIVVRVSRYGAPFAMWLSAFVYMCFVALNFN